MLPIYSPGDHVLTLNWSKFRIGDVIAFISSLPSLRGAKRRSNLKSRLLHFVRNDEKVYFIKRVGRISGDLVFVSGDNKKESAKLGPIKKDLIVGKVIMKY